MNDGAIGRGTADCGGPRARTLTGSARFQAEDPMRLGVAVLGALVVAASVSAQTTLPECGTTEARQRQVDELAVWSAARQKQASIKSAVPLAATVRDGLIVLNADDTTAPFRSTFDLAGRSLLFTRKNSDTFVRRNIELQYDDMTGAQTKIATASSPVTYTLPFAFPFFGTTLHQVSLSTTNAIFTDEPPVIESEQVNDAELASLRDGIIAPLLMTSAVMGTSVPAIQVKEFANRVSISWIMQRSTLSYDVQATLFDDGEIRFSYKRAATVPAAGVVITSGTEPWRNRKSTLVAETDAAGDVVGTPSDTLRPLLDIVSFDVSRVADTNLIEMRIKVAGKRSQMTSSDSGVYAVFIGDSALRQYVVFSVSGKGTESYTLPVWGESTRSPAARMEDDTIILTVLQDYLAGPLTNVSFRAYSQAGTSSQWADWQYVTTTLEPPIRSTRTKFRALDSEESDGPIEQAFTLPILSVGGVWSQIKQAYGVKDGEYDAVAIYQNFLTDLVLYAGAYSSGGNPAVSGIKLGSTSQPSSSRTPNLLHMNAVGYSWNATNDNAGHVILHEFGHRWLLSVGIAENGSTSRALNPSSSHPAQYVHTPAAFRVVSSTDASVMGGSAWTDKQDGTFTSPPFSNYSYSWLDLYLMGLADKAEVPAFFYIANSDPKLGDAYYPPPSQSFKGTRKDVTVQQVIEAMGERKPAYPFTQRHFNVLFVLLTNPDREPTDLEIGSVQIYRKLLEERFVVATGGRATVSTTFTLPLNGPRRRAAGR